MKNPGQLHRRLSHASRVLVSKCSLFIVCAQLIAHITGKPEVRKNGVVLYGALQYEHRSQCQIPMAVAAPLSLMTGI